MAYNRFMIAPPDAGLHTDLRPWLIPDKAFQQLNNAYVFRGRVRKRFGSYLMNNTSDANLSRFRIEVGTYGTPISPVPTASGAIGQQFTIAGVIFTVNSLGNPADLLVANGTAVTATFDTTTGAFVFAGVLDANGIAIPGATPIYFYPALPVMGLLSYERTNTNDEQTIGFDTRYAYQYATATGWTRIAAEVTPGAATWTGSNSQFFWGTNWTANGYDKILFVTNFNENELNFMRFYNGTAWDNFRPTVSNLVIGPPLVLGITLDSARIIVPFKNRLVCFNTWENETADGVTFNLRNYQARARYSQIGSPLAANAWRQDIPGLGNSVDASTDEAIITVEFIKDRLIVYFERSTWELVYTGNQATPFIWQQINTELGAESTFSIIPFDKIAIGVGNVGIHACNGTNVERIDQNIPDTVFEIHNENAGVDRVYGIRDYYVEMLYWTFPAINATSDQPYPQRVLVYNYKNGTWAFNDDSITCFGYFQNTNNLTWSDATFEWQEGDEAWGSGPLQAQFRQVIAGNQEGFTFIVFPDINRNAPSLQITDIVVVGNTATVTAVDHNLVDGGDADFVVFENIIGTINIQNLNDHIYPVASVIDKDTFTIINTDPLNPINGVYQGGGTLARISRIDIRTKQYNFYAESGRNAYIQKTDFMVDRTANGAVTVDCFASSSDLSLLQQGMITGSVMGTNVLETTPYTVLYPFEATQSRLWHPVYLQADGEVVQLRIYLSDEQLMNSLIAWSDFQMHAMLFYATPTSARLQ